MSELSERLRTRLLEVLELVADETAQRAYQAAVPLVDAPAELFSLWDEVYFPDGDDFRSAFTDAELRALRAFHSVLEDVSASTPQHLPPLDEFVKTEAWRRLVTAAHVALAALK